MESREVASTRGERVQTNKTMEKTWSVKKSMTPYLGGWHYSPPFPRLSIVTWKTIDCMGTSHLTKKSQFWRNLLRKMLEALLATPDRCPLFKPRRSLLRRLRGRPLLAVRDLTRKCYSISLNTYVLRCHHLYDFAFIITSSKSFCFQVYNTGRLFNSSFMLFCFVLSSLRCSGLQPNHIRLGS